MSLPLFTWTPAYVSELTKEHKVAETVFENGSKKRYWKGARPRKWKYTFLKNYPQIHEIYDFWDDRKGSYENFQIEIYNGVTEANELVVCHFVETEIDLKTQGRHFGEISLTIEEVL